MNYDFRFGVSAPMEKQIEEIADICDKLDAEEKATIFEFGSEGDLVLHIYKDCEYHGNDDFNIVTIHTAQNGEWVDDTGDIYVADGSLHKELERIWNYRDFATL